VLWATDLNISYSENVAMTHLLFYLTNGSFDQDNHSYDVKLVNKNNDTKHKKQKKSATYINVRKNIVLVPLFPNYYDKITSAILI
jgi:hypothetical protein